MSEREQQLLTENEELRQALVIAQNLLKAVHHWRNSMMANDKDIHSEIDRVLDRTRRV